MSEEEVKTEVKEAPTGESSVSTEGTQQEAPKLSEAEERATALGWQPKDQYDGNPEEWVSAKEFLRRGELFGRINDYKHEIQNLKKSMDALVKHNKKMFEEEFQEEVSTIKQARKQALREGDTEVVAELDDKLEEVEKDFQERKKEVEKDLVEPTQQASTAPHPAWEPWVNTNRWYGDDPEMRGYADGVAAKIVAQAREMRSEVDFTKLLGEVARKTRQRFPEKFQTQERKRTVDRDDGEGRKGASGLDADLRAIENSLDEGSKEIMNNLVRGGMKKEEYLKQIREYNKKRGIK
jgi:hypothetical protein